jgi:hypothetical protein
MDAAKALEKGVFLLQKAAESLLLEAKEAVQLRIVREELTASLRAAEEEIASLKDTVKELEEENARLKASEEPSFFSTMRQTLHPFDFDKLAHAMFSLYQGNGDVDGNDLFESMRKEFTREYKDDVFRQIQENMTRYQAQ